MKPIYNFNDIMTEEQLARKLNVTPEQLAKLRQNDHLPYVNLNYRTRVYLKKDVIEWIVARRVES